MIWQNQVQDETANLENITKFNQRDTMTSKKLKGLNSYKKLLLGIVMLGCIIASVRTSSLSWFTSNASSRPGIITIGTFELNLDKANNSSEIEFEAGNIQPGIATDEKTISFINTGSLDMILLGKLQVSAKDEAYNNGVGDISAYKVIAEVYKNDDTASGNLIYSTANAESGEDISNFNSQLNSMLDPQSGAPKVFKPDEKLICKLKILLDPYFAVNTHQGDTVTATLEVNARQNIAGASYEQ